MGEDLNSAYKIAIGAVIMVFLISIGLSLMLIGRNFWNRTADGITQPIVSMQDNDAFYLSSYEKPLPVADIWKLVLRINSGTVEGGSNGNFSHFTIREQNPNNPNDWILRSNKVADLDNYMSRKAFMSWEINERTGLYAMEVSLVA